MVVLGGGPWFYTLLALMFLYFIIQYSVIIVHEETILLEKFGDEYAAYLKEVPRVVPRFQSGRYSDYHPQPRPWIRTLRIERSTLLSLFSLYSLLILKYFI